jgi:hypothetical protein
VAAIRDEVRVHEGGVQAGMSLLGKPARPAMTDVILPGETVGWDGSHSTATGSDG